MGIFQNLLERRGYVLAHVQNNIKIFINRIFIAEFSHVYFKYKMRLNAVIICTSLQDSNESIT